MKNRNFAKRSYQLWVRGNYISYCVCVLVHFFRDLPKNMRNADANIFIFRKFTK